jgi:hypothetical protein
MRVLLPALLEGADPVEKEDDVADDADGADVLVLPDWIVARSVRW